MSVTSGIENEQLELNRALQRLFPFIIEIPGARPQAMDDNRAFGAKRKLGAGSAQSESIAAADANKAQEHRGDHPPPSLAQER